MRTFPICLVWLDQRRSVVIGGGNVALRKTQALLESGAAVTVISPRFCPAFQEWAHNPSLQLIHRPYQPGDLEQAFLVISATNDPAVNQAVWQDAIRRGCLVNVVDDPQHSNFIVPAVVRRGEVQAAITTGGSSPALARRLRERLEDWLRPAYGELAALLAELRPQLKQRFAPGEARLEAALSLVDSELIDVIENQGLETARARAQELLDDLVNLQNTQNHQ